MWSLIFKNDTNELIYKTETDSKISKAGNGISEGEEINNWAEVIFEEIRSKNFQKLMKHMNLQI